MKYLGLALALGLAAVLCGCANVVPGEEKEVRVQSSVRLAMEDPSTDGRGAFFLRRSLLCRQAFAEALTNLVSKTGRDESALRGATIASLDEGFTNGVYTLQLGVVWSARREASAEGIVAPMREGAKTDYVPTVEDSQALSNWIGPKQVRGEDGVAHFLGISAMAVGRNSTVSQQNVKMAELDAQALAVRAFLGSAGKMADVKAEFRQVFALRSRHPLCPGREAYVCGYEVVSLDDPVKKGVVQE